MSFKYTKVQVQSGVRANLVGNNANRVGILFVAEMSPGQIENVTGNIDPATGNVAEQVVAIDFDIMFIGPPTQGVLQAYTAATRSNPVAELSVERHGSIVFGEFAAWHQSLFAQNVHVTEILLETPLEEV